MSAVRPHAAGLTRRVFVATSLLGALAVPRGRCAGAAADARRLAFRIRIDGFGGARAEDIEAVIRSAAGEIWRHCPEVRLAGPGIEVYHNPKFPITHFEPSADGWIVIGLAVQGNLWARFGYQFSHEFAHTLIDHANDASRAWHTLEHANQWLEESVCEAASLFCLRAMARTWADRPPYPNWKSYAPSLADYAVQHLAAPGRQLPEGRTFAAWFAAEEASLRAAWTQRDKNTIVARQLLPLFEAEPAGWGALPFLKLGARDAHKPLGTCLSEWKAHAPAPLRPFVTRLAAEFGVRPA